MQLGQKPIRINSVFLSNQEVPLFQVFLEKCISSLETVAAKKYCQFKQLECSSIKAQT